MLQPVIDFLARNGVTIWIGSVVSAFLVGNLVGAYFMFLALAGYKAFS